MSRRAWTGNPKLNFDPRELARMENMNERNIWGLQACLVLHFCGPFLSQIYLNSNGHGGFIFIQSTTFRKQGGSVGRTTSSHLTEFSIILSSGLRFTLGSPGFLLRRAQWVSSHLPQCHWISTSTIECVNVCTWFPAKDWVCDTALCYWDPHTVWKYRIGSSTGLDVMRMPQLHVVVVSFSSCPLWNPFSKSGRDLGVAAVGTDVALRICCSWSHLDSAVVSHAVPGRSISLKTSDPAITVPTWPSKHCLRKFPDQINEVCWR